MFRVLESFHFFRLFAFLQNYPLLELLPPQSDFQGKKFFKKNFRPFSGLDGGILQHFYKRLNALKSARIESREDSRTRSVAEIGKNGYFFCKTRAKICNAEGAQHP